jgi:hypothetical protein
MDVVREAPTRPTYATKRDKTGKVLYRGEDVLHTERMRANRLRNEAMQARRDKRAEQAGPGAAERIISSALQGTAAGTAVGFVGGAGNPITAIAGGVIGTAAGALHGVVDEISAALNVADGKRSRVVRLADTFDDNADDDEEL